MVMFMVIWVMHDHMCKYCSQGFREPYKFLNWVSNTPSICFQEVPMEVLCNKSCSKKFRKIHRKTTVLESLFLINFFNRLWHRCFPVNFAKFLRTFFYRILLGDCFCVLRTLTPLKKFYSAPFFRVTIFWALLFHNLFFKAKRFHFTSILSYISFSFKRIHLA